MVFIIIGVQKGLEHIKLSLIERGYTVVDAEEYKYPIDAIIYEGNSFQLSYVSRNNMPQMTSGIRENYGVLMINSLGKSINEIEDMLRTRYYSPLF